MKFQRSKCLLLLRALERNFPFMFGVQLIDCLNWRVKNDIDNVLAVQLHTLCQISVSFVGHFTSHRPLHYFADETCIQRGCGVGKSMNM
jgi:hypothetical protein